MRVSERQASEWRFLQLLCATALSPSLRADLCATLPANQFTELANRVVFEEVCKLAKQASALSVNLLREHLPSRVTARGFPDVDFDGLLGNALVSGCASEGGKASRTEDVAAEIQLAYRGLAAGSVERS